MCRYHGRSWPEWRNGRRDGLKIRCSKGRVGSSPTSGTQAIHTMNMYGTSTITTPIVPSVSADARTDRRTSGRTGPNGSGG